jgi:hypothetical protein
MSAREAAQRASQSGAGTPASKSQKDLEPIISKLVTVVDKLSRKIDDLKK